MSGADCVIETIKEACSLAKAFKELGHLEDARELLDGVAGIEDRLFYLQQMEANGARARKEAK